MKRKSIPESMLRAYGPIAGRLAKAKFDERVRMVGSLKAEAVEETVEAVCAVVATEMDAETAARVRKLISPLHVSDSTFENNRRQTRRAEAYLLAAGVTQLPMAEVQRVYDALDGVDVFLDDETLTVHIALQPKKWEYE